MHTTHVALTVMLGAVGACVSLASCSASSPQPLEGPEYSAASYEPTGARWDILSTGSLLAIGGDCLAVRLADAFGEDAVPRVVALPVGSRLADDGSVELPNGTSIALGTAFSFTQEPFLGTVADLATELPGVSAAPSGCPADARVVLLIPLDPA
jgi:hypothetical protein